MTQELVSSNIPDPTLPPVAPLLELGISAQGFRFFVALPDFACESDAQTCLPDKVKRCHLELRYLCFGLINVLINGELPPGFSDIWLHCDREDSQLA